MMTRGERRRAIEASEGGADIAVFVLAGATPRRDAELPFTIEP